VSIDISLIFDVHRLLLVGHWQIRNILRIIQDNEGGSCSLIPAPFTRSAGLNATGASIISNSHRMIDDLSDSRGSHVRVEYPISTG
jgi:hypothetical protein